MERLTHKYESADEKIASYTAEDYIYIYSDSTLGRLATRLGQYEDAGLTPEEVEGMKSRVAGLEK